MNENVFLVRVESLPLFFGEYVIDNNFPKPQGHHSIIEDVFFVRADKLKVGTLVEFEVEEHLSKTGKEVITNIRYQVDYYDSLLVKLVKNSSVSKI